MTAKNTVKIALTSFLAYAVMASVMSPLGIVTQPIADVFGIEVTDATSRFSYITTGILAGSFIAIFIFDWLRIKTILMVNSLLIALAILLLYLTDNYAWLPVAFAVIGVCNGINLTTSAVVITKAFAENRRASMLLLTDCFYSIGAVSSSFFAAYLMAQGNHWVSAYVLAAVLVIAIVLIAAISEYPEDSNQQKKEASEGADTMAEAPNKQRWPISVYFCAASLFLYLLGMVSLYSWLPNYAQTTLNMPQENAGQLVSYFFGGMFASQIIMFFLVLRFPIKYLLLISSGAAALINISLWNISSVSILPIAVFSLGLFAGGFLKTFITFGTLCMENAPSRLVSFILFCTGLGTAVAPSVSAQVVSHTSEIGGLVLSSGCYVLTFILALMSVYFNKKSV